MSFSTQGLRSLITPAFPAHATGSADFHSHDHDQHSLHSSNPSCFGPGARSCQLILEVAHLSGIYRGLCISRLSMHRCIKIPLLCSSLRGLAGLRRFYDNFFSSRVFGVGGSESAAWVSSQDSAFLKFEKNALDALVH
jgi:hypothetical protein